MDPYGFGAPPPPPPKGSKNILLIVAVVVAVLVIGGVAGLIYINSGGDDPKPIADGSPTAGPSTPAAAPAEWAEGSCVKPAGGATPPATPAETPDPSDTESPDEGTYEPVACNAPGALGKILKMSTDEDDGAGCPDDTDVDVNAGSEGRACVRNLAEPHPGDPGKGGGILRKGDCIMAPLAKFVVETPCSGDSWYGKVSGLSDSTDDCPSGTADAVKRLSGDPEVVCLGKGGQVVAVGDCLKKLPKKNFNASKYKVSCGSGSAWAKVAKQTDKSSSCPKHKWGGNLYGSRWIVNRSGAFHKYTCLKPA